MVRKYHKYTDEQVEYLREISPTRKSREITKMFNEKFKTELSTRNIRDTRNRNNIPSKFSHINSEEDGTFKKGHDSWNKGKKGYMGANKTSFKKGSIPPNKSKMGTERVTRDGYLEVKVANGKGNKNWKAKHRKIYEEEVGEIPKGHVIIFGDGDNTNCDIDNLILISRGQLVKLNKQNLIQKSAELTRSALKIIELDSKITERCKDNE